MSEPTLSISFDGPVIIKSSNVLVETQSPDRDKSGQTFSKKAYIDRINAAMFDGVMNKEQEKCINLFLVAVTINDLFYRPISLESLPYILATTFHETAGTMQPIEEYGKGKGRPYGEPDSDTGKTYYGRGYVQLTWKENYQKASKFVFDTNYDLNSVDFAENPELALTPFYSVQLTLNGMLDGWFTGKKLDDYRLDDGSYDYRNARRIINGMDKASLIAGYAMEFESALRLAIGQEIKRNDLKVGSYGDDVRELQLMLSLKPDGQFGDLTKEALLNFQRKHNLKLSGEVTKEVWNALEQAYYW